MSWIVWHPAHAVFGDTISGEGGGSLAIPVPSSGHKLIHSILKATGLFIGGVIFIRSSLGGMLIPAF